MALLWTFLERSTKRCLHNYSKAIARNCWWFLFNDGWPGSQHHCTIRQWRWRGNHHLLNITVTIFLNISHFVVHNYTHFINFLTLSWCVISLLKETIPSCPLSDLRTYRDTENRNFFCNLISFVLLHLKRFRLVLNFAKTQIETDRHSFLLTWLFKIVLNYPVDNAGERGEKVKRGRRILLCAFIINIIIECMNGIKWEWLCDILRSYEYNN